MDNKSACLISCSDHFEHRLDIAAQHLMTRGFEVTYITSDFDHVTKKTYQCTVPNSIQLHTRPYYKNFSIARILSHRNFAKSVFHYLESLSVEPDLILVLLPPNFLTKYVAEYKRKHPNVRLIFDIFDLWPETFPSMGAKKLLAPFFGVWSWLRDHYLASADFIVTECDLFGLRLGLDANKSRTVYLAGNRPECGILPPDLSADEWHLCYLGSINNIIDIPKICGLLGELAKHRKVTLHIIGSGERLQELIDSAHNAGAEVVYHGMIYDDLQKQKIMCHCHYGLNVLKESVCIGLTMKSVDYFRNGLPVINNVGGDTAELIKLRNCGMQLCDGLSLFETIDVDACMQMRKNTVFVFENYFERSLIVHQYGEVIDQAMRGYHG